MNSQSARSSSNEYLAGYQKMRSTTLLILILHPLLYISIGLNIPVLRQCAGFIYLTFIPGFLILRSVEKKTNITDTFVLSVGLSIAYLMFAGLILNETRLLGALRPLSVAPLTIMISIPALAIFLLSCRRDMPAHIRTLLEGLMTRFPELSLRDFPMLALLTLLPLLSAIGAFYFNTFLLLLVIIVIALVFVISLFSERILPSRLHGCVVFSVALCLVFQISLVTKHIMGWDIFAEYHVFRLTETAGHWDPPGVVPLLSVTLIMNSVLSTTILPTIYSVVLSLNEELVYKVVYPFIY